MHDHYGITAITDLDFASEFEVTDLRAAFIELRDSMKQLLWYWLVNFDKIIGSLTKFHNDLRASDADFAMLTKSIEDLCQINNWLKSIPLENQGGNYGSAQTTLLQQNHSSDILFHSPLTNAFTAIQRDDTLGLDQQLRRSCSISEVDGHSQQEFLFALLYFSTIHGSQRGTERLLSDVEALQDFGDQIH